MHRQHTIRIERPEQSSSGTASAEGSGRTLKRQKTVAEIGGVKYHGGRCAKYVVDATGCDSAAGIAMFTIDLLLLIVICSIQGFVVARDAETEQIERGAKIKCDGAFQNLVRMKEKTSLLTQSKVAFFAANDFQVTRTQFRVFADGEHFSGAVLQAIEWIPEVLTDEYRTELERLRVVLERLSPNLKAIDQLQGVAENVQAASTEADAARKDIEDVEVQFET